MQDVGVDGWWVHRLWVAVMKGEVSPSLYEWAVIARVYGAGGSYLDVHGAALVFLWLC